MFWPLKLFFEVLGVHWDSISQSGSCLGSMRVHSLTLSYTPRSMWCDSRAFSWPAPLQPFCLGHQPKARVATMHLLRRIIFLIFLLLFSLSTFLMHGRTSFFGPNVSYLTLFFILGFFLHCIPPSTYIIHVTIKFVKISFWLVLLWSPNSVCIYLNHKHEDINIIGVSIHHKIATMNKCGMF